MSLEGEDASNPPDPSRVAALPAPSESPEDLPEFAVSMATNSEAKKISLKGTLNLANALHWPRARQIKLLEGGE